MKTLFIGLMLLSSMSTFALTLSDVKSASCVNESNEAVFTLKGGLIEISINVLGESRGFNNFQLSQEYPIEIFEEYPSKGKVSLGTLVAEESTGIWGHGGISIDTNLRDSLSLKKQRMEIHFTQDGVDAKQVVFCDFN